MTWLVVVFKSNITIWELSSLLALANGPNTRVVAMQPGLRLLEIEIQTPDKEKWLSAFRRHPLLATCYCTDVQVPEELILLKAKAMKALA